MNKQHHHNVVSLKYSTFITTVPAPCSQFKLDKAERFFLDFGEGFETHSTAPGFGCCGSVPSGGWCGTAWSSWWCCSNRAGCSLRCAHSQRWFPSETGAAARRCPAALTPAGRFHWDRERERERRTGGGKKRKRWRCAKAERSEEGMMPILFMKLLCSVLLLVSLLRFSLGNAPTPNSAHF